MKKIISLLAVSGIVLSSLALVACGGGAAPSGAEPESLPSVSVAQSEPEPEALDVAYLTGAEKTADYPEGQRIAAVMVGNTPSARPAYGISEAKVLIELDGNARITRFLALYEDYKTMPRVGSVRSARDPFVQLLIPTYGFFVHEGPDQNQPARQMLQQYEYYNNYDLDHILYRQADRDSKIYRWYNTNGETVMKAVEKKNYDGYRSYNSPMFSFVPYNQPRREMADGAATDVTVVLTEGYRSLFKFDSSTGRYAMSQFNSYNGQVEPTIDGNNQQQLAFDNVLVLFAPMDVYPNTGSESLTRVDFTQGGGGFLISNGGYERLIWRKGAPDQPLRLEKIDGSGEGVALNVGTTYIAVVDDERAEAFYQQLQSGTAEEHAVGEVNTDLVDAG